MTCRCSGGVCVRVNWCVVSIVSWWMHSTRCLALLFVRLKTQWRTFVLWEQLDRRSRSHACWPWVLSWIMRVMFSKSLRPLLHYIRLMLRRTECRRKPNLRRIRSTSPSSCDWNILWGVLLTFIKVREPTQFDISKIVMIGVKSTWCDLWWKSSVFRVNYRNRGDLLHFATTTLCYGNESNGLYLLLKVQHNGWSS